MEQMIGDTIEKTNAHYLVDFENTGCRWAGIIPRIQPGDTITIFFSDSTGRLENAALCEAYKRGALFRFMYCGNGRPNAMDFQIMAELGRLSVQKPEDMYYTVSLDRGFESVEGYMAQLGTKVERLDPCTVDAKKCKSKCAYTGMPMPGGQDAEKPDTASPVDEALESENIADKAVLRTYIGMLQGTGLEGAESLRDAAMVLYHAMEAPANKRKMDALNRFRSRHGIKDGTALYKQVRDVLYRIAEEGPFPGQGLQKEYGCKEKGKSAQPQANKKWPVINPTVINTILSQSGITMQKGMVPYAIGCIQAAREDSDPEKTLRELLLEYFNRPQVTKAMPRLTAKYL